jgi:UDP-N-acetylmuramoyl-tripeptide--D-alanyl-D-alanine ligase
MSPSLWTAKDATSATKGTNGQEWSASGVSIDSRTVSKGDLFIALVGDNFDGHDFVNTAFAAGAVAAIVSRPIPDAQGPLLLVRDTTEALWDLARFARARTKARIAAVTGSVGKTGTKEMLRLALAEQGETHASHGNLNNHLGLPLSLARLPASASFAVLEMGMNHAGEIEPLTRLARPHVAVITAIEMVHAEFFASEAAIAEAKGEIFIGLEEGGVAVINRDTPHFARLAELAELRNAKLTGFGSHIEADARLLDCAVDPATTHVLSLIHDHPLAYRLSVSGRQWAMNSLAVLSAVEALGANVEAAAKSLIAMTPPKGRGQQLVINIPGGNFELIDESYNASPASMKAAIASLKAAKPAKGGRRIAILGDMLELGTHSAELHASLAKQLVEFGIDLVLTAGSRMEHLHHVLPGTMRGPHAQDADNLVPLARQAIRPGDVAMVKGSAGSKMSRVVAALAEAPLPQKTAVNG